MACSQTLSGLAKDCETSIGGVAEVYIANYDDVSSASASSGKISTITMKASAKFKRYAFARNTANMVSNYVVSAENGTQYVETTLVMVFNRMETTKRVEITALAQGDLAVIVKDNNGTYFYLGKDEAVNISAGDGNTGTAKGDRNGYSITLMDASKELPFEVDSSAISSIVD